MDREAKLSVNSLPAEAPTTTISSQTASGAPAGTGALSRRKLLRYGLCAGACAAAAYGAFVYFRRRIEHTAALTGSEVFKGDAPNDRVWQLWQERGWVREARHYLKLGGNVACRLCPNECLLEPGDRSHCRNKVNVDGTLYTLAYGNPCAVQIDPIEKKPLYHFLPRTDTFSIGCSGCGFRCLNCQNWHMSQRKPEELKDPRGAPIRLQPRRWDTLGHGDMVRASMFPEDVLALTRFHDCPSVSYTYSEPIAWYEYMLDSAREVRRLGLKNVWVTCGYIQQEPLEELCQWIDAASVNLKSFSDEVYRTLNTGKLQPVLDTLMTLKRLGVWFEIVNLIVPTYTDKPDMIRQMCDWIVEKLGPDCPLHFSRFVPHHKLLHLEQTPKSILEQARDIARQAGLHYVYIGNCEDAQDGGTTYCPNCRQEVITRRGFFVTSMSLNDGKCASCGTRIAGVWKS